ncbi:MAG: hypothetical protein EU544_00550 [Promethearchaeota archaeon]|nr:MAG: hypothetical protein EU544_00550 [Candidatus Lokiarchaeota archaeon]
MSNLLTEKEFFSQSIAIKKKYLNRELYLHQYFCQKTRIIPENVIICQNFIFFFVENKDYFQAKKHISRLRKTLSKYKIQIIRAEHIFIKLLFSFFPDIYIHDVHLEFNNKATHNFVDILLLSYEERGIAIGGKGDYIKVVNEIFNSYIEYDKQFSPLRISCKVGGL